MNLRRAFFIIGLSALLVTGAVAVQAATTIFAHFYLIRATASPTPWWGTSTRVDNAGGVHTAFYTNEKIYYAHCAMVCDNPDNWTATPIADVGSYDSLSHPVVEVDAVGHPRLMWYYDPDYAYAECNANCEDAASWTAIAVPVASPSSSIYPNTPRYFALDSQGRPRFVTYGYGGFQYATCDTDCTTVNNWHSTLLDLGGSVNRPQLVMNGSDQPRVMGTNTDAALVYFECNADCLQAASWNQVILPYTVNDLFFEASYSFRLDGQGRPRIAFYDLNTGSTTLRYAWSNANPLTVADWSSYGRSASPADARSVDLAFDGQNRPHLVFDAYQNDVSLRYWACMANCETTASTWQEQDIETGDELDASDPIPLAGCIASAWAMVGAYPSLTLDGADRPNVSYYAVHSKMCLGVMVNITCYTMCGHCALRVRAVTSHPPLHAA